MSQQQQEPDQHHVKLVYGTVTRELYEVWCRGLNGAQTESCPSRRFRERAGQSQLQSIFHQASLYPSQSQILEMIHCARERRGQVECSTGGHPDPADSANRNFLTFGEFCLYANELKRCYEREIPRPIQLSAIQAGPVSSSKAATGAVPSAGSGGGGTVAKSCPANTAPSSTYPLSDNIKKASSNCSSSSDKKSNDRKISSKSTYQVFLGGSCNPTTWRQDIAIPALKSWGITYFNPQVPQWGPELIEKEHYAKQTADVLFFVVDRQTRSVATIIEAAYYTAAQKTFILVVHPYEGPGQLIQGEPITQQEYEDLSNGQLVLQDMVERLGIPVFDNVRTALDCTAKIVREKIRVQDLGLNDGVNPVKNSHYPIGDKLLKLRDAFNALDTNNSGELSMADVCMAFRILTNRDLSVEDLGNIVASSNEQASVTFDQFCCILTEFRNLPAENQRRLWDVLVSKAAALLHAIVSPVSRILLCRPSSSSSGGSDANGNRPISGSCTAGGNGPPPMVRSDSSSPEVTVGGARDIYLGGSCGSTTWRETTAIPLLKKSGLTYFNPQTGGWSRRFIPIEAAAMDASRVLLFVISRYTRSLSSMALAAHYIGLGCNVVLCVQQLAEGTVINGETLTPSAIKDYNRGRNYLSDLANREGVPVFDEVHEAVECAIQRCQQQLQQSRHRL